MFIMSRGSLGWYFLRQLLLVQLLQPYALLYLYRKSVPRLLLLTTPYPAKLVYGHGLP